MSKTTYVASVVAGMAGAFSNTKNIRAAIETLAGLVYDIVGEGDDGLLATAGDNNYIGNAAKTSYNRLTGHTKFDDRPAGGTSDDYAVQIRSNSAKAEGTHWGLDAETHLIVDGAASLRSVQGVAVVDAGKTLTAGTLNGVYGQVRADGTVAGNSFMAALYGIVEAGAAITANHVTSLWLDSHQDEAVTGQHDLMYLTNNGEATMDQVMHIYGGDKISKLMKLDTVEGMVSDNAETGGAAKKIAIDIDGTTYYINAYAG